MSNSKDLIPNGAWPVMLTPFNIDRSIDWAGVDALVDYYATAKVAGIFTVCLSSEIYQMNPEERVELATRVVKRADGRVPVIASAVAGSAPSEQADAVKAIADTGVTAVVLLPCLIADEGETNAVWRGRVEQVLAQTGDIPLGFYECPRPYKRGVAPDDLGWAASTGRVLFHKDTCHNLDLMKLKLAATKGSGLKFFNTQMGTLIDTLEAGGHGFSSYAANLYPELVQWVSINFDKDRATALKIQQLLAIAEHSINSKYPASAKYFVSQNAGVDIATTCRSIYDSLGRHDQLPLLALIDYVRSLDLPIEIVSMGNASSRAA
ncbi:dihydrodipicolinate synthase family protein [Devosia sp. ZW T5_3]|uniref:dihydrodipicolinate synthase family protein n=1 Tax=Devosia sp. ZW T5_3 TaxID=3378085 RepID=UPI0038555DE7